MSLLSTIFQVARKLQNPVLVHDGLILDEFFHGSFYYIFVWVTVPRYIENDFTTGTIQGTGNLE